MFAQFVSHASLEMRIKSSFFVCHSSNSGRHFFHIQLRVWILKRSRLGESRWWNQKLSNRGSRYVYNSRTQKSIYKTYNCSGTLGVLFVLVFFLVLLISLNRKNGKDEKFFFLSFCHPSRWSKHFEDFFHPTWEKKWRTISHHFHFHIQQILNISWEKRSRVTSSEEWVFARDGLLSARKHRVLEVNGLLKIQV